MLSKIVIGVATAAALTAAANAQDVRGPNFNTPVAPVGTQSPSNADVTSPSSPYGTGAYGAAGQSGQPSSPSAAGTSSSAPQEHGAGGPAFGNQGD